MSNEQLRRKEAKQSKQAPRAGRAAIAPEVRDHGEVWDKMGYHGKIWASMETRGCSYRAFRLALRPRLPLTQSILKEWLRYFLKKMVANLRG